MKRSSTEHANLYAHFKEVGDHSFRSVVQFWDAHYEEILQLPISRYFEMLNEYGRALFELGKYKNYLDVAEEILELSIEYNISVWENKDVIQHTLVKKAAAHYHLHETDKAEHLLIELLKIKRDHKTARHLLERCMMRKKRHQNQGWKAATIILMLSSAFVVAIELCLVRPYWESMATYFELFRNGLFILGLAVWASGEVYHRIQIKRACRGLIGEL
jgi:tetratricopeptide (TPR) repeat protein